MRHIERYFKGIDVNSVCTGTIAYFGLRAKTLMDRGIIAIQPVNYGATSGQLTTRSVSVDEYVFRGFPENEEELQNAPIG